MKTLFKLFLCHFIFLLCAVAVCSADGLPVEEPTRDPRLPPVLPGEVVEKDGVKMKTWSTSGEVAPHAVAPAQTVQVPSIILDNRDGGFYRKESHRERK